jgi:SAM-dependent methyltransferase
VRCGSCSRNRHVAICVTQEFECKGIARLADFSKHPELKVFNASTATPVAKALGKGPNIRCSEYFDDVKPGQYKNGIQNQDLQNLTFDDGTLDLILSEDVFEHVADVRRGFQEVHRVLKKGGFHIFSIPYSFDSRTKELFSRRNGELVLAEPIEYHGDPIRGRIPCYTHIGFDIIDTLGEVGFDVRIEISRFADETRFGTFDSFTFITRKR